jgi:hypothetical protein
VRVDQILAGGKMPYQVITVDVFLSGNSALKAFDAVQIERHAALTDLYTLSVHPKGGMRKIF